MVCDANKPIMDKQHIINEIRRTAYTFHGKAERVHVKSRLGPIRPANNNYHHFNHLHLLIAPNP